MVWLQNEYTLWRSYYALFENTGKDLADYVKSSTFAEVIT